MITILSLTCFLVAGILTYKLLRDEKRLDKINNTREMELSKTLAQLELRISRLEYEYGRQKRKTNNYPQGGKRRGK